MRETTNLKLVTIAISTYNSGKYILETLDSLLLQSYKNIELIIGDDASTDDSLAKVRNWVAKDENRNHFTNVKILEVEKNTGPSANGNRKLKAATGEWIKFLGADDTLMPSCIDDNMQFTENNPEVKVLFSKLNIYKNTFQEKNLIITTPEKITQESIFWPTRTAESQYRMLLVSDRIHFSPSVFLHRETLLSVGGFDERFRLLEDYPLWLNLTGSGYKLYFMDKITVNYRRHIKAINNTGINYLINPNYFKHENFRNLYTYPHLPTVIRLNQRYTYYLSHIFRNNLLNQNTKLNRFLLSILTVYINPFKYFIWLKKRFTHNPEVFEFYN